MPEIVVFPIVVPDVRGLDQNTAATTLNNLSIQFFYATPVASGTVGAGLVLSQTPAPPTLINQNDVVILTLSAGSNTILLNDAITLATQAGLNVLRPVSHAPSSGVDYGNVISQVPPAGSSVPPGTMVILTVSDGPFPPPPPTPSIPNVVNMLLFDAQTAIMQHGCNVNPVFRFQNSATVAQGAIIAQSPAATSPVVAGTVVTLTVSLGIAISYYGTDSITVPSLH